MTMRQPQTDNADTHTGDTDSTSVVVWTFNAERGDFDGIRAHRRDQDTYELLDAPAGQLFEAGDLVRCELSDGELIVQERVFRHRLI
jgi:hypothetical protein